MDMCAHRVIFVTHHRPMHVRSLQDFGKLIKLTIVDLLNIVHLSPNTPYRNYEMSVQVCI